MAICVLVFLATMAVGAEEIGVRFGVVPLAIAEGEIWRLLTSAFVHAGLLHLGFNLLVLFMLGPPLERMLGHARFLALYLISALGGATMSYLLLPPVSISIGASGAIFGLMGALVVAGGRFGYDVRQVVFLTAINLVISFVLGSFIDWRAHVGGLVVGAATGAVMAHAPTRFGATYQVVGCGAIVVALLALGAWRTDAVRTEPLPSLSTSSPQLGRTTPV